MDPLNLRCRKLHKLTFLLEKQSHTQRKPRHQLWLNQRKVNIYFTYTIHSLKIKIKYKIRIRCYTTRNKFGTLHWIQFRRNPGTGFWGHLGLLREAEEVQKPCFVSLVLMEMLVSIHPLCCRNKKCLKDK